MLETAETHLHASVFPFNRPQHLARLVTVTDSVHATEFYLSTTLGKMQTHKYSTSPDNRWTFNSTIREVSPGNSVVAKIEFERSKEEGILSVTATNSEYEITHEKKHGIWRLRPAFPESASDVIIARKPKFYRSHFLLEHNGQHFAMIQSSTWRRNFSVHKILDSNVSLQNVREDVLGELTLVKRGKQYNMSFTNEVVGYELPAFCFWLATMMRRRDAEGTVAVTAAVGGAS